jgi:hypothetical protein
MEVIDILGDGFNEQDLLEIYPSKRLINLSQSDTALAVMRNWRRSGVIELVGQKSKKSGAIEAKSPYSAATAMFAGLVRLAEKTYSGQKLNLFFEFDGPKETGALQIWGFRDDEELKTSPPLWTSSPTICSFTLTLTRSISTSRYTTSFISSRQSPIRFMFARAENE